MARGANIIGRPPYAVKPAGRENAAPWMVACGDGANALACVDGLRMVFDDLYQASAACAEAQQAARAQPRRAHR
jgi:hypothetical protein